jgi:hypothetical protein
MQDQDQIPTLRELIKDVPPKYLLLLVLVGIVLAALAFWTIAIRKKVKLLIV